LSRRVISLSLSLSLSVCVCVCVCMCVCTCVCVCVWARKHKQTLHPHTHKQVNTEVTKSNCIKSPRHSISPTISQKNQSVMFTKWSRVCQTTWPGALIGQSRRVNIGPNNNRIDSLHTHQRTSHIYTSLSFLRSGLFV